MKSLANLIGGRLKKLGIEEEAFASLVLEKTKQMLENNFEESFTQNAIPQKYKKGIITIRCTNSSAKHFFSKHSAALLPLLQKEFPKESIKKLFFH